MYDHGRTKFIREALNDEPISQAARRVVRVEQARSLVGDYQLLSTPNGPPLHVISVVYIKNATQLMNENQANQNVHKADNPIIIRPASTLAADWEQTARNQRLSI